MTFRTDRRTRRLERVLSRRQPDLTVVMENIHDPHNVAAILRSCDATGILDVNLLYDTEEFPDFSKIGKQSSAGTRKWLRPSQYDGAEECFGALRKKGFRIFASRLDERAVSLYDMTLTEPTALVFGNEHRGVSDEAAEQADGTFIIPMVGMVQSLNVSVATAVTLYEAFRQRSRVGMYDRPSLGEEEYQALLRDWLQR